METRIDLDSSFNYPKKTRTLHLFQQEGVPYVFIFLDVPK